MKVNLKHVKKCDQVWEDMIPCKDGRICQKCTKTLIDFRELSDTEMTKIHMFSEVPICGIYHEEQLTNSSTSNPLKTIKKYSKIKAKAMWLAILGLTLTRNISAMEEVVRPNTIQININQKSQKNRLGIVFKNDSIPKPQKFIAFGKMYDENSEPLIGATVYVKGTRIGTVSDIDGKYFLDVSDALDSTNQITFVFSYVGYKTIDKAIHKR